MKGRPPKPRIFINVVIGWHRIPSSKSSQGANGIVTCTTHRGFTPIVRSGSLVTVPRPILTQETLNDSLRRTDMSTGTKNVKHSATTNPINTRHKLLDCFRAKQNAAIRRMTYKIMAITFALITIGNSTIIQNASTTQRRNLVSHSVFICISLDAESLRLCSHVLRLSRNTALLFAGAFSPRGHETTFGKPRQYKAHDGARYQHVPKLQFHFGYSATL